ncbi:translation initiation factor IF-2 [Pseudidiomarina terrestris]|uniref:Translation initiation factor IF-2 n=1 Tax=Pseudidiomarina terrestris TaxID=2820060 RepID=A0AAW7QW62_9GAMM|nr:MULTISPECIES: translation initiation factor IF-2 [unclassified Pseudidiomarina]MDN7123323.1 translation initiation factor IF-2 [Pseudidiomarina sp. 1APP75-32.1]MDN7127845.1 translation initiation factor IF-2 [Pseudidiomarina sp. 1APR75-33.1]MDN7128952.1 translation initiation factor IF-2 [Pseudidiomarina sp. 1APR75-15]MDN7134785.1 translation initiation factor IF-2 [Pseudidiomarina sp. 1ASP75-5]MDN7137463.1 translation initiation factor IF-2 [Pseudidiomarina sp. 1ASP75-14]
MDEVTLDKLAKDVGTTVDRLVTQFAEAGMKKKPGDSVTEDEKQALLAHLNKAHGGKGPQEPSKMTLKRKEKSTLSIGGGPGKSKSVQVEVRKKRTYVKRSTLEDEQKAEQEKAEQERAAAEAKRQEEEAKAAAEAKAKAEKKAAEDKAKQEAARKEKEKAKAKAEAEKRAAMTPEERKKADEAKAEAERLRKTQEEEARKKAEAEAARQAEEARKLAEENSARWQEEEAKRKQAEQEDVHFTTSEYAKEAEDEQDVDEERRNRKKQKRRRGDDERDETPRREKRRKGSKRSSLHQAFTKPASPVEREVKLGETITVGELASRMAIKASEVIKAMMKMGEMVTINQVLDQETASLVVEEMGHKVVLVSDNALEQEVLADRNEDDQQKSPRAPVVTVMGHVDHGKTSLLDHIRKAKVAAGEAGGITQHIGAYHVETDHGMITFLDTPGHAAFTSMRARGAGATDIVILVVAADDGVMPQTVEAIQHAKAAGVPLVVAINKMDKPEADPDRVKNELAQRDVIPEDWGGDVQFVPVSAHSGEGVDALLEAILLQSEVLDLQAVTDGMAHGIVIESRLDKGRGPVASILVQEGTLRQGDIVLCGLEYGRIRAMRDELGRDVKEAGPSIPVEILGLSGVPQAGDEATVVKDERKAREVANYRQGKYREIKLAKQQKAKLENMFANMQEGDVKELNIVLKSDVQGSLEAIADSLQKLSTDEVKVNIIGSGVGGITETDASLAGASNAIIVGFNVRADASAKRVIEQEAVDLRYYSVIYDLIDEIKLAMGGMLAPEFKQQIIGLAEVRDVFKSPKIGAIAGCMVTEGIVKRSAPIRVLRDNVVIYEGELESLRRFKDDVQEVRSGMECGIGVKNYNDVKVGDQIEVFETVQIERSL